MLNDNVTPIETKYFIPISNDSKSCGAVCNDDQDPDGRIIDTDGRYEQVERLHPGEPGYVLYAFDSEHGEHAQAAWEGGRVNFKFARYVASYREKLTNPQRLSALKDAIREELRAHSDGCLGWHSDPTEHQLGLYLTSLRRLRAIFDDDRPFYQNH